MQFARRVIEAFSLPPSPPCQKKVNRRRKLNNLRIVSDLSEGNILLQKGRYLTEEEMNKRKLKVAEYKF